MIPQPPSRQPPPVLLLWSEHGDGVLSPSPSLGLLLLYLSTSSLPPLLVPATAPLPSLLPLVYSGTKLARAGSGDARGPLDRVEEGGGDVGAAAEHDQPPKFLAVWRRRGCILGLLAHLVLAAKRCHLPPPPRLGLLLSARLMF